MDGDLMPHAHMEQVVRIRTGETGPGAVYTCAGTEATAGGAINRQSSPRSTRSCRSISAKTVSATSSELLDIARSSSRVTYCTDAR